MAKKDLISKKNADGTTTVKVAAGKTVKTDAGKTAKGGAFLGKLPSQDKLDTLLAANEEIIKNIENDDRQPEQIVEDLQATVAEAETAAEALDLSIDAIVDIDSKIDELDAERLEARLQADAENRPLDEAGIARAKEIMDTIFELRHQKKELLEENKDARLVKAEADVKAFYDELALEASYGQKLIGDYEAEILGEAVQTGEFEANSPEWHEQRRSVIGGSDISVIMGTSVFNNANKLMATKLGLVEASFTKTMATGLGDTYEPIIQREFAKRHAPGNEEGNPVFNVYHTKASWRNKNNPTHGANLDGLYDSTGQGGAPDSILEIKAVSKPWDGKPPQYYREQVLWYMHITGLRKGKIACLTNQTDYAEYDIIPEPGEIESIVSKVQEFEKELAKKKRQLERQQAKAA